jgi:hypothetical protein
MLTTSSEWDMMLMFDQILTLGRSSGVVAAVAMLTLACTGPEAELVDANCVVTQAVFDDHIYPRHCDPNQYQDNSKFLAQYCTLAAAQQMCASVQNAPAQVRTVQPDGRVRYDSELGVVVGTNGEMCGRLVINGPADGMVVTLFPERQGGVGLTCH